MTERDAPGTDAGVGDVRAPRGLTLSCKGWGQEAALRMLMNCADPDVAERRGVLRDGVGLRATIAALRELNNDQTLLVRSGAPSGTFVAEGRTPRVVIASGGVASREEAAAASWLYVGTQAGMPMAYEAFGAAARKHFGGTLAGRLVATCGMGATGGALPLAATLNGAAFLGIEADAEQIKRRVKSGYCEVMVNDLDEALRILKNSVRKREAASVGLIGNCADVIPELAARGVVPDLLVDCTSAYGSLEGYIPCGLTAGQARESRGAHAESYRQRALDSIAAQVRGILELQRLGSLAFRFGGALDEGALEHRPEASEIPDFTAQYIRPLWSAGRALLVCAALSGEPADIARADQLAMELFSGDEAVARWIRLAGKHVQFQGLPARVCLVDPSLRVAFGLALNNLVAQGIIKTPLVIGCAGPGGGAGASPAASTATSPATIEGLLAGLTASARVASWVAIEDGGCGGVIGSALPMFAIVADGTPEMARRIERALGGN